MGAVKGYFQNLEMIMWKYNFLEWDAYNVDETGISTFQNVGRILGPNGQKEFHENPSVSVYPVDVGSLIRALITHIQLPNWVPKEQQASTVNLKRAITDHYDHEQLDEVSRNLYISAYLLREDVKVYNSDKVPTLAQLILN
jgi:hypothetical protein